MVVGQSPLCLLGHHLKSGSSVEISKGSVSMGKHVEVTGAKYQSRIIKWCFLVSASMSEVLLEVFRSRQNPLEL